jgi:hypothetical protein
MVRFRLWQQTACGVRLNNISPGIVISVSQVRLLGRNQAVIIHHQIPRLKWQDAIEAYRMKGAERSKHGRIAVQSLKAIG